MVLDDAVMAGQGGGRRRMGGRLGRWGVVCAVMLVWYAAAAAEDAELDNVVTLLEFVLEADEATAVSCLDKICQRAQTGELSREQLVALRARLEPLLRPVLAGEATKPLYEPALLLAAGWGDDAARDRLRSVVWDASATVERRGRALDMLAARQDLELVARCAQVLQPPVGADPLGPRMLEALSRYGQPEIADVVLRVYPRLSAELRPRAIAVLTQRAAWSRQLLLAMQRGELPPDVLNVNQIRGMSLSPDPEVAALAARQFGTVRAERNPQREQVLGEMRRLLESTTGDAERGQQVFHRLCGQCHRIHGRGQDVGPDITRNGRSSFDQLLSNVFDPSLVIGPAYQAVTAVTVEGRILTGLITEESEQRVILKLQGGQLETIPRAGLEELLPSQLSLMPEGLERQLMPQEIADLFAFLTLDLPPDNPAAKLIPGTPADDTRSGM
ncbi:MAG: hypothetical protein AB7O38_22060 [Pirellulaceae bacterium]